MDLPNVKELRAILKLCREQGVNELTVDKLSIKFGELPNESTNDSQKEETVIGPTDEELLYWSSQPDPKEAMLENRQ